MTKLPKTQPVARESASIPEDQLSCLRTCFPEAFTEGKVDMTKLQDTLGDIVETSPERYSFTWAGKKEAIRILQTPSRATLIPSKQESVEFDDTKNLFIEGDNLEVLKLLYKSYFGRVKMIYIDPPYNTGKDFIYPDNYTDSLDTYLKLTGQKDSEGNMLTSNPETSGRYHSSWLSMMYPRLFLARQLLKDDGAIFVSIDEHEMHNLRFLMDEIFGEENLVACLAIVNNMKGRNDKKNIATAHEYLYIYAKSEESFDSFGLPLTEEQLKQYKYTDQNNERYALRDLRKRGRPDRREDRPNMYFPIYFNPKTKHLSLTQESDVDIEITPKRGDGTDGRWRWGKDTVRANLDILEARYSKKKNRWDIDHRVPLNPPVVSDSEIADEEDDDDDALFERTSKSKSFWWGGEISSDVGKREFKELFPGIDFDYPKSPHYISRMLSMATKPGDTILDFFAGSCPTAQAIIAKNRNEDDKRKFIAVQLPEPTNLNGFGTIAEIGKERIRRALKKYKSKDGFKVFKLAISNYRSWTGTKERDADALTKQMEAFNDPLVEGWKPDNVLYEVAIKEGFSLNIQTEHIKAVKAQEVQRVTDPDREQSFYLCLDDRLNIDTLAPLKLTQNDLFICRDVALDDTAAANLALQCRLKTI